MPDSPRKITFASPAEPSGASWLINCFLELGIRVDHRPAAANLWRTNAADASIWIDHVDHLTLHPRAEIMGKWIPSLVMRDRFVFRDDVVIDYRQDLPLKTDDLGTVILFLRDPRDALYSMYRRRGPDQSLAEFCTMPNSATLLPAADHWLMHAQSWAALADGRIYLFEAYKQDATALLSRILADLKLPYAPSQINAAIAASGLEQARTAEAHYRQRHPEDTEVANRAGIVGDWRNFTDGAEAIAGIEAQCSGFMHALGMTIAASEQPDSLLGVAQSHYLSLMSDLIRPPRLEGHEARNPLTDPSLRYVQDAMQELSSSVLARAKLPDTDILRLTLSMAEFTRNHSAHLQRHLTELGDPFRPGNASQMSTLAALMRQRRAGTTG